MEHCSLTQERLKELLVYDQETGIFTWAKHRGGTAVAGTIAGHIRPNGYTTITVDLKFHYAHRLAWLYVYGEYPSLYIDHINGDPKDNRIDNLRLATQSQNMANAAMRSNNVSGFKGVSWSKRDRVWRAYITANGDKRGLGSFKTKEEAYAAYVAASTRLHGEFSRPA